MKEDSDVAMAQYVASEKSLQEISKHYNEALQRKRVMTRRSNALKRKDKARAAHRARFMTDARAQAI